MTDRPGNNDDQAIFDLGIRGQDQLVGVLDKVKASITEMRTTVQQLRSLGGLAQALRVQDVSTGIRNTVQSVVQVATKIRDATSEQKKFRQEIEASKRAADEFANIDPSAVARQARIAFSRRSTSGPAAVPDTDIPGLPGAGGDQQVSRLQRLQTVSQNAAGATQRLTTMLVTLTKTEDEHAGMISTSVDALGQAVDTFQTVKWQATEVVDGVTQAADALRKLATGGKAAAAAGDALEVTVDGLDALSGAADGAGVASKTASTGLLSAAKGFLANVGPLALVSVAVAAVAAVAVTLTNEINKANKQLDEQIEAQSEAAETAIAVAQAIRDMSSEQARAQQEDLRMQRTQWELQQANLEIQIANAEAMFETASSMLPFLERFYITNDVLPRLRAELDEVNRNIEGFSNQLNILDEALPGIAEREAAEELARAEEQLLDVRVEMVDILEGLQRDLAQQQIQWAREDVRRNEDQRIMDTRSEADFQEQIQNIERRAKEQRIEIVEDLNKSILEAEEQYVKANAAALESLNKQVAQIGEDLAKSEAALRERVQEEEMESLESHARDVTKAEAQYRKERLRRIEDMNDDLLDAEMKNDVVAFLQARKQGEKDLRRMKEDHDEQMTESQQEFARQRQERRENAAKELADLREQAAERRAELIEQYNEEKALRAREHQENLQEMREAANIRIQEAREALAKELAEARAARQKELQRQEEDRKLEAQRRAEDRQRETQQIIDAAQERMRVLGKTEDQINQVIASGGRTRLADVQRLEKEMRAQVIQSYQDAIRQMSRLATSYGSKFSTSGGLGSALSGGAFSGGSTAKFDTGALGNFGQTPFNPSTFGTPIQSGALSGGLTGSAKLQSNVSAYLQRASKVFGAQEGIVTNRPTLVMMSEDYSTEAVVPIQKSGGIPKEGWNLLSNLAQQRGGAGGGQGPAQIVFDFSGMVNRGNLDEGWMRTQLEALGETVAEAVREARFGQMEG